MEKKENLVHTVSARGADIRTTPMAWKREGNHLEWIVRQMSWQPPWCTDRKASVAEHVLTHQRSRTPKTQPTWLSKVPWVEGEATPPLIPGDASDGGEDNVEDDAKSSEVIDNSDGDAEDFQSLEEDEDSAASADSEQPEEATLLHQTTTMEPYFRAGHSQRHGLRTQSCCLVHFELRLQLLVRGASIQKSHEHSDASQHR